MAFKNPGRTLATETGPEYHLQSDIAQFCLPAASRDSYAKYAYANSLFVAVLVVGIIGIVKTPIITEKTLPDPAELIPVELTQPAEPPPPVDQPEKIEEAPPDAAPSDYTPIVVAPANAHVAFPVQVEGNTIVSANIAVAELTPAVLKRPERPPTAPKQPSVLRMTRGKGGPPGIFPNPPFIPNLLRAGQSASLEIYLEVAADGAMTKVEITRSSGVFELDRKVLQHVKSRWRFDPPGEERRYTWEYEMRAQ